MAGVSARAWGAGTAGPRGGLRLVHDVDAVVAAPPAHQPPAAAPGRDAVGHAVVVAVVLAQVPAALGAQQARRM